MSETSRGRPRDPGADEAILQAALDLFLEGGVEGTSIEGVARRAGVGKLTIYRRWSSKEDLLAAAIEHARDVIPDLAPENVDVPLPELVEGRLPVLAAALAEPRVRAMVARVFGAATSHPELVAVYWDHYVAPRRRAVRALLDKAQADGTLDTVEDPDVLIDMMVGAVLFRLLQPEPLGAGEAHEYLASVYRRAGLLR
ncbi:TetR/AcrR family transcriptional regulator [Salinifilum aidingensis]